MFLLIRGIFFEYLFCIPGSAVIPRIGFPKEHAKRFEDPPDLVQTVTDAELRLDQVLDFGGRPAFFLPEFFKQRGFLLVSEFRRVATGILRNQPTRPLLVPAFLPVVTGLMRDPNRFRSVDNAHSFIP